MSGRETKFPTYRMLPLLEEHVLVGTVSRTLNCRRSTDEQWVLHDFRARSDAYFASIGLRVTLAVVFENVGNEI